MNSLESYTQMVTELCRIAGTDEVTIKAKWEEVEGKILRYAALDTRKSVKTLVTQYNASDEQNAGQYSAHHCMCMHVCHYTCGVCVSVCMCVCACIRE